MLRKKICRILSAIMIATSVFGAITPVAKADVINASVLINKEQLQSGIYTIKNTTKYVEEGNATGEGMARKVLKEDSKIVVQNDKVLLTMYFDEGMFKMLSDIKVSMDDTELIAEVNNDEKSVTMEVPSVDSKVKVDVTVSMMGRQVSFYVENNMDTLTLEEAFEEETGAVVLGDGKYKASNITRYSTDSEHGNSSARRAIESETLISVENGRTYLTITFSSMYSMLENITVSLDGRKLEIVEDANAKTITFEVPSVNTEVLLGMNIKGMNHPVDFYVVNDMDTLAKISEEIDTPAEDDREEIVPETPETTPDTDNNGSASGIIPGTKVYTIKNQVYHENATGMTMARQYLNSTSKVEEVNGKYYVTMTFTGVEYMNNHQIYVNGSKVDAEIVESTSSKIALRFAVESLSDSIKVGTYVIPMGRTIDFDVKMLEDTLTLVDGNVEEDKEEDSTNNSTGNNSSSTNNSTSNSADNKVEEETNVKETVTVKVYNVQNNVTHHNATGVAMARKYLNSNTEVKEINGKYYVTLTFTGTEFMQNHEIYVNGSKVSHSIVSSTGDSVSIKFTIASLNDAISVKTYVVPMARDVEFGVELLLDTMTLVNEYTIEADSLPETGATTSSALALSMGLMAIGSGALLRKKVK
ncbi:MAG: NEAT domain-containing protein [Clostridium sp.]|uniref:NEAT domain-containing protein n=1 Tax=Clostridium sp. TaxID=1506 RepID=UPI00267170D1|nr:NEAT domain-containing protein [Clostridium sp.]MDD7683627.1 NEAT domain-containing protein [Clostridium sp.]MDY2581021.1 NEAT domain-containing protein [Clostridium sp.]